MKDTASIVESIQSQYINILTYRPLSGSSYVKLPAELKSPKKGLIINIKNNDRKCFLWWHVRLGILIRKNTSSKNYTKR